jgi:hypothetical protein
MPLFPTYNERTDFLLEITFVDTEGDPLVPGDCFYHIHDITNDAEVRAWKSLTVAHTGKVTVPIEAEDLDIIDDANVAEDRVLTVHCTYSGTKEANEEYRFRVKNLVVVPKVVPAPGP